MPILRMVTGIQRHLDVRIVEWVMAGQSVWYGLRLVGPETVWTNASSWEGMTKWATEEQWGWICIGIGVVRLLALIINGTFDQTAYAQISPHVRTATAGAGAVFWFMVFLSVLAGSGSGVGIYNLPLLLDLWCARHASRDAGRARTARVGTT